jgi:hypothetical protein
MRDSFDEAQRLGHQWVGPEHVLLAILDDTRPSIARSVLNEFGVTHRAVESGFLATLLDASPAVRSTIADGVVSSPAPIFYEIEGWIAGFAAAHGAPPTVEIALLSLCTLQSNVVAKAVDPSRVVAALATRGVTVPKGAFAVGEPGPIDIRRIDVPIDKLANIRGRLLESGLLVGFNTDAENGEAWVFVSAETDAAYELLQPS